MRRDVSIGGRFLGVSTRANGRTRANFLNDPGTGRDRAAVTAVKTVTRRVSKAPKTSK
jgi:hypothetical protein